MTKRIFLTTAIPYVNDAPHIGHSLEIVQSDALARFYRLNEIDTYFLWGTDENAIKNVESAQKKGVTTQELVDLNTQKFQSLKTLLNLSYDDFIRTSSDKHKRGAQKFWNLCKKDIYKKKYRGLYCTGCEAFYKEGELENNLCPIHNQKLEVVEEENYFFSLSKYQKQLEKLITTDKLKIFPDFRKKEVLNFIKKGLEDISISRPKERTKGWGVEVPEDPSQIMYVWFDALTNYITALDFEHESNLFKKYWTENPNRYHVVGKDIVKFHSIYWPAMLLSAGLPPPTKIFVHGFINVEGKKMSKTLGNIIDPFKLVEKYGVDAVRYYLLKEIPTVDDGDYSDSRMQEIYDSDLANELGNLVSRVTQLAERISLTYSDQTFEFPKDAERGGFTSYIENYQLNLAIEELWKSVKGLNTKINEDQPWKISGTSLDGLLKTYLKGIRNIAFALSPFLPETSKKIVASTQGRIKKAAPLFPKS